MRYEVGRKIFALLILTLGMWCLIGSAPAFWSRGHGFESGISYSKIENLRVERVTYPRGNKDLFFQLHKGFDIF